MSDLEPGKYLVTGASGGIGSATVRRLAKAGVEVYASGRDVSKLDALCAETGATAVTFDLTKDDEVADAVGAHQWFGVVNCGGNGGEIATPQDTDMAVYDRVMAINARGTLLVTKFAAPGMIEAGRGGSIVNVSSQASLVALKGHISYGSSKAAVDNITRVSALELGPYGIRVNAVNPTARR
ncbi:SDR family NAD(P)-dependent oxidoreductase [Arsenicicoccus piscis]|uniref:SDR family NAD(P)-dependent oxidoreductase n=1 Tax=Arsenicicoccus piscis TaxID=673954 RepID=UPI002409B458|nr:SDR family NAD(P)-dependent oxidoreductase [Arsenicicoccus piscis]